eukprot:TRINITY_DN73602_c0_g1_i1.p1 TRINITY_DN73602_c0_g1~~TRINITY_DN73602_c0_g1_i1.p1  ORF type:complete len:520 (+),score=83.84 TRINITY_DN73602_c0_g1_i1:115-1674(+)
MTSIHGITKPPSLEEIDAEDPWSNVPLQSLSALAGSSREGYLNCRLVACSAPSPTCADKVDAARLQFREFQTRVGSLVDEFFRARDIAGMTDAVVDLGCSCFHDELVAVVIRGALDRKEVDREAGMELLTALAKDGHITTPQLVRGFEKLVLSWEDVSLDAPETPWQLVAILSKHGDLWHKSLFNRLPDSFMRSVLADLPLGPLRLDVQAQIEALKAFKAELFEQLKRHLFADCSLEEFASWLQKAEKPSFHHEVVLGACVHSLGIHQSSDPFWTAYLSDEGLIAEKGQLVISMLSSLHRLEAGETRLLDDVDVQLGFSRLLGEIGKVSDAGRDIRKPVVALLRGAVESEVLPAEFLKSALRMRFGGAEGVEVLKETQRQTPVYSRRIWGTGDQRQFRLEISNAISEYFDSKNAQELARILGELHLSVDEEAVFVRKMLVVGMERGESASALDAVEELQGFCWSPETVKQAFQQLRDIAGDLVLDFPHCRELTTELVRAAIGRGILDPSYLQEDGDTIV